MIRKKIKLTVEKCYRPIFGSARLWICRCDGLVGVYIIRKTKDKFDVFPNISGEWVDNMLTIYDWDITDEDPYKTFVVEYEDYTDEDDAYGETDLIFLSGLRKDGRTIIINRNDELERMWGKVYSNPIIKKMIYWNCNIEGGQA